MLVFLMSAAEVAITVKSNTLVQPKIICNFVTWCY